MASTFAWLSYSSAEQETLTRLIRLLPADTETRDELGIGSIRDGFADLLFPGSSTIQTRARYFLFIPWMYQQLEHQATRSSEFAHRARHEEVALINHLCQSSDTDGIIGSRARAKLQRLPSNIYWQGLAIWGIRHFPGAQDTYHRMQDTLARSRRRQARRTDDGDPEDGALHLAWHPSLPPAPEDFPAGASFQLTPEEAAFLRERLLTTVPHSLLAWLVDHSRGPSVVPFPWAHPQYAELPDHLREQLAHARLFSEVLHGAALLYNLMLAEMRNATDLTGTYRNRLHQWARLLEQRRHALATWDLARLLHILRANGARIPATTAGFVQQWVSLVRTPEQADAIPESEPARRLIRAREQATKGKQARLHNASARERWGGASGTGRLDYRWPTVQTLINDIVDGLERGVSDAASAR
jgi:hypothetical protein